MPGNVEAEGGEFVGQQFVFGPLFGIRKLRLGRLMPRRAAENKPVLAADAVALDFLPALHGAVDHGIKLRPPRAQRIERAGLHQAFQHAPIQVPRVH